MWDHEYEGVWGLGSKSLSPQPQGGAQLTHLSRRTTPSMQAPKRTTLLKSAATSRKAGPLLPLLPPLTPHTGPQGPPCPSFGTPATEVSCRVQINPLNVCMCVRVDVYVHACVVCLHMPDGDLNTRTQLGIIFALAPSLHSFWSYFSTENSVSMYWCQNKSQGQSFG